MEFTDNRGDDTEPGRYSVFLTPAGEDFAFLERVIAEVCAKYDSPPFEPHLTLYSGTFPDPEPLRRAVDAVMKGAPPITAAVSGIGYTPEYFRTLFLEFHEHPLLRMIHERLKRECGDLSPDPFAPHLSLLYADLPLGEKAALAARVHLYRESLRFDSVKLVTPLNRVDGWRDTGQWHTLHRWKLEGEPPPDGIRAVLFDFGGVIATEGFREGLRAIAQHQGLDPEELLRTGMDAIYDSGYITGQGSEARFWEMMRLRSGISGTDHELSVAILSRFDVRPRMLEAVRRLRRSGVVTALLSDQTDWLELLDERYGFYGEFDRVFNSYRLGKGKRDASIFSDAAALLGIPPGEALFVDDMPGNVERAISRGMRGMLFRDEDEFLDELERLFYGRGDCV